MPLSDIFQFGNLVKLAFDLNDSLDLIEINESNSKDSCYICKKGDKSCIYNEFIIYNGPLVKIKCDIIFFKNKVNNKYIPRITFYKENKKGEIKDTTKEKIRIEFVESERGLDNFWKVISFLMSYKDLVDTGNFDSQYKVISTGAYISEFKTKDEYQKTEDLRRIFSDSDINEKMIREALSDNRKLVLDEFRQLLMSDNYSTYKEMNQITQEGDEPVWHYFLKKHDWLLGLNIEVKFLRDFIDETSIGNPDTSGKGNPRTDIMGISDYTTLIELKTSNTCFFTEMKSKKARTGTWSFTPDFIEGVSQCLKQKFDWDKNQKSKEIVLDGEVVDQQIYRTVDPKVIFIIGNKQKELDLNIKTVDNLTKRDTLERFRRNNRNIEILSFDELYERAYFIVYKCPAPEISYSEDIPF